MNKIHKGIKPTRKLLRMSQGELNQRMGRAQSHLSGVETGKYNGSIRFYEQLCEVLGLPFIVLAMEALQVEEIRNKDMAEFLSIKEQLYRFLEVDKVLQENDKVIESRKIADKICQNQALAKSSEELKNTPSTIVVE